MVIKEAYILYKTIFVYLGARGVPKSQLDSMTFFFCQYIDDEVGKQLK